MGQAKARGTFAERPALAVVERERQKALRAEDLHEESRVCVAHLGCDFADSTVALNMRSTVGSAGFNNVVCHNMLLSRQFVQ